MFLTIASLFCFFGFFLWYYLSYNGLVSYRNATEQSWSNVEVELKRRFDLIQNLIAVAKGYVQHERSTLEKITALRVKGEGFDDPAQAQTIQREITNAVINVVAIAEAYPDLKADSQFLNLQSELTETENRIAERRSAYNRTVNAYLNKYQIFPGNVIASVHSFPEKPFFDAPDEIVKDAPKVDLQ